MGRFLDVLWSDGSFFLCYMGRFADVMYGPMGRFQDVVWPDGSLF